MAPKQNPLKLNPLQLRTLTVLQQLARVPGAATRALPWKASTLFFLSRFAISQMEIMGTNFEKSR